MARLLWLPLLLALAGLPCTDTGAADAPRSSWTLGPGPRRSDPVWHDGKAPWLRALVRYADDRGPTLALLSPERTACWERP